MIRQQPINLPPLTAPVKRSVLLDGHATSVSLEDAFWRASAEAAVSGPWRSAVTSLASRTLAALISDPPSAPRRSHSATGSSV